jgi:cell division protein FtsI/penicillin-binding protein 2
MGSVPAKAGAVEHAADAIGQGQVLASPLTVASVAASVAAGHYAPPYLVVPADGGAPASPASSPAAASDAAPAPSPSDATDSSDAAPSGAAPSAAAPSDAVPAPTALAGDAITSLQALMGEVVTSGTGTALKGVPGEPVHGKTGTAEFGSANPPLTHAWFTGYQDDVAFAVVVESGGFGGKVAAPLAADFLRRLAG